MFVQWRRRSYASCFKCSTMALPSGHARGPEAAQSLRLVPLRAEFTAYLGLVPVSIGAGYGGQSHHSVMTINPLGTTPLRWFFKRFSSGRLERVPNSGGISPQAILREGRFYRASAAVGSYAVPLIKGSLAQPVVAVSPVRRSSRFAKPHQRRTRASLVDHLKRKLTAIYHGLFLGFEGLLELDGIRWTQDRADRGRGEFVRRIAARFFERS